MGGAWPPPFGPAFRKRGFSGALHRRIQQPLGQPSVLVPPRQIAENLPMQGNIALWAQAKRTSASAFASAFASVSASGLSSRLLVADGTMYMMHKRLPRTALINTL